MKLLLDLGLYFKYCLLLLLFSSFASNLQAEVYYSKEEALKLPFPEADKMESVTVVLNPDQQNQIESLAKVTLQSKLFDYYIYSRDKKILGYAVIDSHTVRSQEEVILIVFSTTGKVNKVVVLAFYEPLEYLPSARWLEQFQNKSINDNLLPGQEIHGIVGSTLTTSSISKAIRENLAKYEVAIKQR